MVQILIPEIGNKKEKFYCYKCLHLINNTKANAKKNKYQ